MDHHLLTLTTLGWAAFHTIWVTMAVWGIALALQPLVRRTGARAQHAVACLTLIAGLLFAAGAVWLVVAAPPVSLGAPRHLRNGQLDVLPLPSSTYLQWFRPLGMLLPYAVAVWAACALVKLLWLIVGLWGIRRAVKRTMPCDASTIDGWEKLSATLAPGRCVKLLEHKSVQGPAAVGWHYPVILLPKDFVDTVPAPDLRAALAHELAHVGRRDYAIYVLQMVIESVLFFDLGIWLLGRTVRYRRENCCDELAVAALGISHESYINSIFRLARAAKAAKAGPVVGLFGGPLLERFRYLRTHAGPQRRTPWLVRTVGLVVLSMIAAGAASASAVRHATTLQSIVLMQQVDLAHSVNDLFGVRARDNPDFLKDMQAAVQQQRAKRTISNTVAVALAEDVDRGIRPDALLRASLPSCSATSARARTTLGWYGGGKLEWEGVARSLGTIAAGEPNAELRRKMSRAALIISAQTGLTPGVASIRILAGDSQCVANAGLSVGDAQNLWVLSSIANADCLDTMALFERWRHEKPAVVSPELIDAARTRPFLQWVLSSEVAQAKAHNEARYASLRDCLKSSGLEIAAGLVQ